MSPLLTRNIAQVSPGDSPTAPSDSLSSHSTSTNIKSLSKGASIALALIVTILFLSVILLAFMLNRRAKAKAAAKGDRYVTPVERIRKVVRGKKGEGVEVGELGKEEWEKEDADVERPRKVWSPL